MMKVIARLLGLVAMVLSPSYVVAQQVATIGIGDITYSAQNRSAERSSDYVLKALNTGINRELLSTRKFSVLEYPQLTNRLSQQGRTLDGYYAKKYTGNAVNQVGLDYILKADVTEFGLYKQGNAGVEKSIGSLELDFELVAVGDATSDFNSSLSAQHSVTLQVDAGVSNQEVLDHAIARAVDQLVDQVVATLFPIRIMRIDEAGTVTLNYGAGLLEQGDTVFIYPADADIEIDKSGKPADGAVATLQVTSSERKFATAQALSGFQDLEKGQKGKLLLSGS